ncbi:MAG: hypothetical protein Q9184_006138, partial [Pyrenodesmia sp. 2 TL-2023]
GVSVPGVLALGAEDGWMLLEKVEGETVKSALGRWRERGRRGEKGVEGSIGEQEEIEEGNVNEQVMGLMRRIGEAVGRMHEIGVVHGDLTTSNLMLQTLEVEFPDGQVDGNTATNQQQVDGGVQEQSGAGKESLEGDIVLIDFGLAGQSVQDEDKAVDLYVLERAFGSTHPEVEEGFKEVSRSYGESYKGAKVVLKRLEEVRMRGRKKNMIG